MEGNNYKNNSYPGIPIPLEVKQKRLYHYTTLESFLKIWVTKKLLFSNALKMNDILESHKNLFVMKMSRDLWNRYQSVVLSFKQISLTMDYDSYIRGCMSRMMWGHYGQKGEGVCIELNPERLDLSNTFSQPITYTNYALAIPPLPSEIETQSEIEDYVVKNKDIYFFTKTTDWSGENEYRILSNKVDFIDISNAITSVYVTSPTSLTCQCVETLVKGAVEVRFLRHNTSRNRLVPVIIATDKYRQSACPQ